MKIKSKEENSKVSKFTLELIIKSKERSRGEKFCTESTFNYTILINVNY